MKHPVLNLIFQIQMLFQEEKKCIEKVGLTLFYNGRLLYFMNLQEYIISIIFFLTNIRYNF